jgi:hypothetical protein
MYVPTTCLLCRRACFAWVRFGGEGVVRIGRCIAYSMRGVSQIREGWSQAMVCFVYIDRHIGVGSAND